MSQDIKYTAKKDLRVYAKNKRNILDIEDISNEICNIFKEQNFYKYSKNILGFYPFNNEIDLTCLYKDTDKNWFLPKCEMESRSISIYPYVYGDILVKNKWGVYEPADFLQIIDIHKVDVAIIPALMADKAGHRLGYGAGFYDRFIPGLRKDCLKIVPLPDELFVDILPSDHWDIPVNKVITQSGIYDI